MVKPHIANLVALRLHEVLAPMVTHYSVVGALRRGEKEVPQLEIAIISKREEIKSQSSMFVGMDKLRYIDVVGSWAMSIDVFSNSDWDVVECGSGKLVLESKREKIGIRPGEVCKIERNSKTALDCLFYRVCK